MQSASSGKVNPGLALFAVELQARAQRRIRTDAAGDDEAVAPGRGERSHGLAREDVDDRRLRRRREIGACLLAGRIEARRVRSHGRLQASERKVERVSLREGPGQRVRLGIAELGESRQCRSAGVAEAEQLGRLVERLAGGVVDGVAEERVAADIGDVEELRVTAGNQQRDKGKGRRVRRKERRQHVSFQVMDADGRPAERGGQRAGDSRADEQGTRQSGAPRVRNDVDVRTRHPCPPESSSRSGKTRRM